MKADFNLEALIRPNIRNLTSYSSARDEFTNMDATMIFLDANENPNDNGVNRYPDPQQSDLKKTVSRIKDIPENRILLGNGSDEVLDLVFRAFCEPKKDNVIILPPTYGMYKVLANINDIECKEVVLNHDFQPNVSEILRVQNQHSKLLFICSPNNPTSNLFNKENIENLLQNFNGLVVIDEAYIDFTDSLSWIQYLDKFPNLIVSQTLSKAYGMAGIRLGMCFASEEIISVLNKIKPPYNVNKLAQLRAMEGLQLVEKIASQIEEIKKERNNVINALSKIEYVKEIYHSDANFILVKVDNANKRYQEFIENGIVVRNRTNEPLCDNCLRFTIGIPTENEQLIKIAQQLSKS